MTEAEKLLYRSNLLGSDKRVTNYGGGNTSAKIIETDPLTRDETLVLWVKGSGGDLGTIETDGFATLHMEKLNALKSIYRGAGHEDEMVDFLPHCTFNLNPRAASIDTPLHAFVPHKHVDHVHPDAVIAIAASENGEELTKKIFGDDIGWLPWKRPGFELGLWLENFCTEHPNAKGVVLGSHGLFTWADDAEECYRLTIDVINQAIEWFGDNIDVETVFGGQRCNMLPSEERLALASELMPVIRGLISEGSHKVGHFDDSDAVLAFVCSNELRHLAALGTSCPDHFLRTKIRPLVLDVDPTTLNGQALCSALPGQLEGYRKEYADYYERCRHPDSPAMRDPNPVIYLIPGVGMVSFAKDKATARIASEFYVNAINVMRGASSASTYCGLAEQEAFDIEYWALEEAKLQRMPKPKCLAGRIAFITGGAGGIGKATARRLADEGACVMLADVDRDALSAAEAELSERYSSDVVRTAAIDVTDEDAVDAAYHQCARAFGGADIIVSNAGISSAAPIEDTTLDLWNHNMSILSTGYFLVSRAAFILMKKQGMGGSVVFIGSKNGVTASINASAYCTAKASELHLARCLALEGAPDGIRVNAVNPDAVLRGSKIWQGDWLTERAKAYGKDPSELEEHYRQRSLLKRSVYPEDVAEAVFFLASDQSAKSTGNMINVDAGNLQSFTR